MGKKARHLKKFLTKNELAYRTCILYESMHGKPAQEVYDKMQKVFPKRDYYTFQYWYFRFLNGNYDLNHDPSLDPKNPDATLPKMPINVMEKIVDCLDLVDTLSTGKVCRELRDKVDKVNKMFDEVEVRFKLDHVIVETRRQSITYRSNQNGGACLTVKRRKCDKEVHKECKKTLEECDYLEMAVKDIASFMKKRNWGYHELEFEFEPESEHSQKRKAYAKQFSFFESILSDSSIHAERLVITAWNSDLEPMEKLLPYMKAGVLESIKFKCEAFEEKSIENIMEMDQWKRAKELDLSYIPDWIIKDEKDESRKEKYDNFESCLLHAERFSICFKNPNFKGCYLSSNVYQYLPEQEYPVFLVERVMPDQTFYDIITGKYWDWHSTQDLFNITATEVKCGPHRMLEYVELRIERIRNQNS